MNNQDFAPFYVGQEVEAVESHPQGAFCKQERFIITGVYLSSCKCSGFEVTVGLYHKSDHYVCHKCHAVVPCSGEWKFLSSRFRAITPAMEAVTFQKITEQHPVSVN